MTKENITVSGAARILKGQHNGNISKDAKTLLIEELEAYGDKLSVMAHDNAKHAGRKTIQAKDIRLAVKNI